MKYRIVDCRGWWQTWGKSKEKNGVVGNKERKNILKNRRKNEGDMVASNEQDNKRQKTKERKSENKANREREVKAKKEKSTKLAMEVIMTKLLTKMKVEIRRSAKGWWIMKERQNKA